MKRLVSFFEIPATDFNRAVKFYGDVLNVKMEVMECETEKMAFFPEEEGLYPGSISFSETFKPSTQGGVLISLNVDDIDAALEKVMKNGGSIVIPKTKILADNRGYFAVFTDCEGNQIGFYGEK